MALPLLVSKQPACVRLRLNRPESKNALNPELLELLTRELERVNRDPTVRVLVLEGAGGSFCSGADLQDDFEPANTNVRALAERLDAFQRLTRMIVESKAIVMALVDGPAVGFGADLALACDLRLVTNRAYFQEKFVALGLMPDGGATFFLPRLVGTGRAMELLVTGRRLEAQEALDWGLANQLVESDTDAAVQSWVERLTLLPPIALQKIKSAVHAGMLGTVSDALDRERQGQLELLKTEDLKEGLLAFREKRRASFQGR